MSRVFLILIAGFLAVAFHAVLPSFARRAAKTRACRPDETSKVDAPVAILGVHATEVTYR